MALYWAAECKKCKKLSGIRPSKSQGPQIDLRNPSEQLKATCPRCGFVNDFVGSDFQEVEPYKLAVPPQS